MAKRDAALDAWVVAERPPRDAVDWHRPYAFFSEQEHDAQGNVAPCSTILLTNRECPWRCVMCDLWKNTTVVSVPAGAVPAQIAYALARLAPARILKLYNSGSFFDRHAIAVEDYGAIAQQAAGFERVVVESHPLLVGGDCVRFRDALAPQLEVAMGLETAHAETLRRLNKGFTPEDFAQAAAFLTERGIALRVFLLVHPPFLPVSEARAWVERSLRFAFACGATAVSLLLTRGGNGAMERLREQGEYAPAPLEELEHALAFGLALGQGRVFADTWEIPPERACAACCAQRVERLRAMNLRQRLMPAVVCAVCGGRG